MSNHARKQSNPRTREKAAALIQARAEALQDLRATFGDEAGQRTLARLRAAAGIDQPTAPSNIPAGWTAGDLALYREGQRSIVLGILEDLATPEDMELADSRPRARS